MTLAIKDIEQIEQIVERIIDRRPEVENANVRYEIDLRERTIRVEEELKHQRELMMEGFKRMDERFEQVDKRFEQVDKRFEAVQAQMDKRFEQVDKRFEAVQAQIDKRFEQVEKRIEQVEKQLEQNDKRFMELGRRLDRFMFWSLGITITCAVFVVNYLK